MLYKSPAVSNAEVCMTRYHEHEKGVHLQFKMSFHSDKSVTKKVQKLNWKVNWSNSQTAKEDDFMFCLLRI